MLPKKIHVLTRDAEFLDKENSLTRAWISINPHEDRTEYTDLSQMWHGVSVEPERGVYFIAEDNKGGLDAYCWTDRDDDWTEYVCLFGLIRWMYIKDLLPKGV